MLSRLEPELISHNNLELLLTLLSITRLQVNKVLLYLSSFGGKEKLRIPVDIL